MFNIAILPYFFFSNGSGTAYAAGGSYTANAGTTLYAQWVQQFTVTAQTYTNGSSSTTGGTWTGAGTYNTGATVSIVATAKSGYAFRSWTVVSGTATGINTSSASTSFTISGAVTLRANFAQTYTITYNANSGSGAPSAQTKYYGETLTLSNTVPTRSNYIFRGWNTAADGSGTDYAKGASYTANSAVTLYAKWVVAYTYYADVEGHIDYSATSSSWFEGGQYGLSPASVSGYIGDTKTVSTTAMISVPRSSGTAVCRFTGWQISNNNTTNPWSIANSSATTTTVTVGSGDWTTIEAHYVLDHWE